ncbi:SET domain-containing protein, partial [Lindgomyces ingoldianus]
LYEARQTLDRGIGLFAKTSITAGSAFMFNSPVVVVARGALSGLSHADRDRVFSKAIQQLPKDTRKLFLDLARSRRGNKIDDIFQTNSMGMELGGVRHLGVVPEAARINHACRPNSYYRFDSKTLNLEVFALHNIKAGEELTFGYGYTTHPHTSRREALKNNWSFTCTCNLCMSPPTTITASDARLKRIAVIKSTLPLAFGNLPRLLKLTQELITLFEEESLVVEKPKYEEIIAYTYSQVGDEDQTRYWAGRARKGWEIIAGKGSWEARRMEALEGNVRGHPSW